MSCKLRFAVCSLFTFCGIAPVYGAKPPACQDIPLVWTVHEFYVDGTTLNAIRSVGGSYVQGESGVIATIQICNGTMDAVLQTGSSRQISFDFGTALAMNSATPGWATGIVTGTGATLHLRNFTFVPAGYDRSQEYTFTTRFGGFVPGTNTAWVVRMWQLNVDAMSPDPSNPDLIAANTPYSNSSVHVYHCPANSSATSGPCVGVLKETWFAWPDEAPTTYFSDGRPAPPTVTQVLGLVKQTGRTTSNAGQFSMRFLFKIELK